MRRSRAGLAEPLAGAERSVIFHLDELEFVDSTGLRLLVDGVRRFNRDVTGAERPRSVAYFLRDEHGRIVGGVQGDLWGRSIHIAALWVDENYRGQGHGSELMKALENYANSQGHPLVYLETTSFQALPFYQGLGLSNLRRVI